MGTVVRRATGFADVGRKGRRIDDGFGETDGSRVGGLEETAIGTTATADGATTGGAARLGPGVDQPPSGKDVPPLHAATDRISAGSRRSGRMAGRDRMRDSLDPNG
jgi:hypothetical protein